MLKITFYNLSVELVTSDYILLNHIREFIDKHYTSKQRGFGKNAVFENKVFASKINDQARYFLHANQFIHLYHYLHSVNYKLEPTEKIDKRNYEVATSNVAVRDGWKLRDYQVAVSDFLLNNPIKSKLVPMPTGSGKTATSLISLANLKQRLSIVILPVFIEKWVQDIVTIYNAQSLDVMVVQGSKSLAGLISMAKLGTFKHDYIVFSNRTLQDYISSYEENPEQCAEMYGCEPIELFPLLGIGILLIDESHMQFNSIFKILLYANVKFQVGLSATMLSDDNVVSRLHKIVYPSKQIYTDVKLDKYTDVYAVAYTIPEQVRRFISTKAYGSNTYSHIAFEQSIIRRPDLLQRYYNLINGNIEDYFIDEYIKNDKLLIFVSTIKLATHLSKMLAKKYPKFNVKRYCENDSYEEMLEADIIISTIISCGTGVDIPSLRVVIQTVSISSQVANIQSMGRLRKLKDRDVKFCYLYANNIDKQKEYHLKRKELFSDRTANFIIRSSRVGFN